jgi:hypothetical protein
MTIAAIQLLIEQVALLPDAETRQARLSRFTQISARLHDSEESWLQCCVVLRALVGIASASNAGDAERYRAATLKTIRELRSFIEEDKVTESSRRDETLVTNISSTIERWFGELSKLWRQFVTQQVNAYAQLANASTTARLVGAARLAQAVRQLGPYISEPPCDDISAEQVARSLQEIRRALEHLGLQGRAGEFLVATARDGAPTQMLYEQEVQQFLDNNSTLRDLLKVKLS